VSLTTLPCVCVVYVLIFFLTGLYLVFIKSNLILVLTGELISILFLLTRILPYSTTKSNDLVMRIKRMNTKVIMFQFLHEVSLIVPKKVYYERAAKLSLD